MTTQRDIYYISGNTTILAKNMAKALLTQFPDTHFNEQSIPFIRNTEDAVQAS
jgi:regulator of PEP synthase PpsR (kinase-PPPase family)